MVKRELYIKDFFISVVVKDLEDINYNLNVFDKNGIDYLELEFFPMTPSELPIVEVTISIPLIDVHSCWTPGFNGQTASFRNKGIPEYHNGFESKMTRLAPVSCWYSLSGENRLAISLSEAMESVSQNVGAYEEDRCGIVRFKLFQDPSIDKSNHKVLIRLDSRDIPFYDAIQGMASWYESGQVKSIMTVPESALEPVFSTWYNFHQNVEQTEIEEQCKLASEVGCKTIILDDGWQTDDCNRGYSYCGDWNISENRFPDMKAHVKNVQSLGMKYMLWLSVPYLGKKSKAWNRYKDYLLFYNEKHSAGVLDPRYKIVRDYLSDIYLTLVKEYNFDGLKLDFIDEFDTQFSSGSALDFDSDRCTESVQEAVRMLLIDVRTKLQKHNFNILIEFRQKYIGPMIREFGNIFRVHDCPHDFITNRIGVMDLRLFSGDTAVHSDMLIWSPDDTLESASLHFISTLFSVPQISPNMKELTPVHIKMVKHWLNFWSENKQILMKGKLKCVSPELQYPIISSELYNEQIISVHANMVIDVSWDNINKVTIVNGAMSETLSLRFSRAVQASILCFNCIGEEVSSSHFEMPKGLVEVEVPLSGYIVIELV